MIDIAFQPDPRTSKRLLAWMKKTGDMMPVIRTRAINKVLDFARVRVKRGIAAEINLTQKVIEDKGLDADKATFANPVATLTIKGKRVPLFDFKARQNKKGVVYRLSKRSGRTLVPGAFKEAPKAGGKPVTVGAGHKGVFVRVFGQKLGVGNGKEEREKAMGLTERPTSMQPKTWRRHRTTMLNAALKERKMKRGRRKFDSKTLTSDWASEMISRVAGKPRVGHLPIVELKGPSIPGVFQKAPGLAEQTLRESQDRLDMEMNRQLEVVLKRGW